MSISASIEQLKTHQPKHVRLLQKLWYTCHATPNGLEQLMQILANDNEAKLAIRNNIIRVFSQTDITYTLVDNGIFKRTGFGAELTRKLKHKILPELKNQNDFIEPLELIFKNHLPSANQLENLLQQLELTLGNTNQNFINDTLEAIEILSFRITASATENEFFHKFKQTDLVQKCIQQHKLVQDFVANYNSSKVVSTQEIELIEASINNIVILIDAIKKEAKNEGVGLQLSYTLKRINQQLERISLLLQLIKNKTISNQQVAQLLFEVLNEEQSKNSFKKQWQETTYQLAYQITEHESKTGEHYIAETKEEYKSMFFSSCGGGVFATGMTVIKTILHHLHFAPLWQAFAYSLNYASGFVGIQLTHATLATKQPAMTASKIAQSLDVAHTEVNENDLKNLAITIGKVSRSQFISFVGNLIIVFPLTFAVAALWHLVFKHPIIGNTEAYQMLHDVHPYKNPTWYYASITGIFLFLSGIISGYYDNKVIYSKIPERLKIHPKLQRVLTKRMLIKLSKYIQHNLGSLIGNISLGFMLGTAGFIGFILGLPFDIRHITISSGNYALAVYTLGKDVQLSYALICLVGVLGIGAFNFLISFSLAIFVAIRSRKVKTKQVVDLLKWTGVYFRKHPKDFFIAPKTIRKPEEII